MINEIRNADEIKIIEITPEMISTGVSVLDFYFGSCVENSPYSKEDAVEEILKAVIGSHFDGIVKPADSYASGRSHWDKVLWGFLDAEKPL